MDARWYTVLLIGYLVGYNIWQATMWPPDPWKRWWIWRWNGWSDLGMKVSSPASFSKVKSSYHQAYHCNWVLVTYTNTLLKFITSVVHYTNPLHLYYISTCNTTTLTSFLKTADYHQVNFEILRALSNIRESGSCGICWVLSIRIEKLNCRFLFFVYHINSWCFVYPYMISFFFIKV